MCLHFRSFGCALAVCNLLSKEADRAGGGHCGGGRAAGHGHARNVPLAAAADRRHPRVRRLLLRVPDVRGLHGHGHHHGRRGLRAPGLRLHDGAEVQDALPGLRAVLDHPVHRGRGADCPGAGHRAVVLCARQERDRDRHLRGGRVRGLLVPHGHGRLRLADPGRHPLHPRVPRLLREEGQGLAQQGGRGGDLRLPVLLLVLGEVRALREQERLHRDGSAQHRVLRLLRGELQAGGPQRAPPGGGHRHRGRRAPHHAGFHCAGDGLRRIRIPGLQVRQRAELRRRPLGPGGRAGLGCGHSVQRNLWDVHSDHPALLCGG
mmetsp:Transcript_35365/g.55396  ORF Transcript_35365/g.55396 Transcript_35365/m.55396 type:complete len:319 (+) Transcript_35365:157-1113(+)